METSSGMRGTFLQEKRGITAQSNVGMAKESERQRRYRIFALLYNPSETGCRTQHSLLPTHPDYVQPT
jgi:hypothetical protein